VIAEERTTRECSCAESKSQIDPQKLLSLGLDYWLALLVLILNNGSLRPIAVGETHSLKCHKSLGTPSFCTLLKFLFHPPLIGAHNRNEVSMLSLAACHFALWRAKHGRPNNKFGSSKEGSKLHHIRLLHPLEGAWRK
jgi:hypothetical protein